MNGISIYFKNLICKSKILKCLFSKTLNEFSYFISKYRYFSKGTELIWPKEVFELARFDYTTSSNNSKKLLNTKKTCLFWLGHIHKFMTRRYLEWDDDLESNEYSVDIVTLTWQLELGSSLLRSCPSASSSWTPLPPSPTQHICPSYSWRCASDSMTATANSNVLIDNLHYFCDVSLGSTVNRYIYCTIYIFTRCLGRNLPYLNCRDGSVPNCFGSCTSSSSSVGKSQYFY